MKHRVLVYPNIWENEALIEDKPWSKIQAFIWLLTRAAQKPVNYSYNGYSIKLQRGEVWTSVRQLSGTLRWGIGKVERYIQLLKQHDIVEHRTEPYGTILTIKNFSKYQGAHGLENLAPRNTLPEHRRNTSGTPPEHLPGAKRNTPLPKSRGESIMEKSLGYLSSIGEEDDKEGTRGPVSPTRRSLPANTGSKRSNS